MGEQRGGSQQPRSHLQISDGFQQSYCPLLGQSWSTWHKVAMSYHRNRCLSEMAVAAQLVVVVAEAG